ncbi:hypothetical protein HJC23_010930 [Cyclotella cryptica]|uniref:Uncharacterized protein n=1 Tax=Cyclotella cryptica TaxID=29204 RepID=A0ABD3Q9J1_9STRA|eukprot:CCRYP_007564-RA/>CCRYP_007564-RA protein AED:0.68 eAED:0.35 QI:0/-1/0/1/-1/1/1/0/144
MIRQLRESARRAITLCRALYNTITVIFTLHEHVEDIMFAMIALVGSDAVCTATHYISKQLMHLHIMRPCQSMARAVQKIPGSQNTQVFVGTSILLGLCAVPVFSKDTKAGHDLFSQEKPQAIVDSESKLRRGYMESRSKGEDSE